MGVFEVGESNAGEKIEGIKGVPSEARVSHFVSKKFVFAVPIVPLDQFQWDHLHPTVFLRGFSAIIPT